MTPFFRDADTPEESLYTPVLGLHFDLDSVLCPFNVPLIMTPLYGGGNSIRAPRLSYTVLDR